MRPWWNLITAASVIAVVFLGCDDEPSPTDVAVDVADAGTDADDGPDSSIEDIVDDTTEDAADDVDIDAILDAPSDGDDQDGADSDGDAVDDGNDEDAADEPDVELQPCDLDFDCDPGEVCRLSTCVPFEPECTPENECIGEGQVCVDGICLEPGFSPHLHAIIFNEVLTDGNVDGDPNRDGSTDDPVEEEFVEIVNVSSNTIDISSWVLIEIHYAEGLPRHTFEATTELEPGDAVVVFGGGNPPESTNSILYFAANAQDLGFGLDLDDGGDVVQLLDAEDRVVAVFAYGPEGSVPAVSDASISRSPDLTGGFVRHSEADGAGVSIFSPGTRANGSSF